VIEVEVVLDCPGRDKVLEYDIESVTVRVCDITPVTVALDDRLLK